VGRVEDNESVPEINHLGVGRLLENPKDFAHGGGSQTVDTGLSDALKSNQANDLVKMVAWLKALEIGDVVAALGINVIWSAVDSPCSWPIITVEIVCQAR